MKPVKFIFTIYFLYLSVFVSAQPTLKWSRTINNTRGEFVLIDSAENVFSGGQLDYSSNSYSIFLSKYDSTGSQIWYSEPAFGGNNDMTNMILDDSSNIYLSDYSEIYTNPSTTNSAALCAKLDSSGDIIWFDKYRKNNSTTLNGGNDVLIEGQSNLWVKGTTQDSADSYTFDLLIKYTLDGQRIFLRTDSLNFGGSAYEFCTDNSGNIYFAAAYRIGAITVMKLFKYDSNGIKLWEVADSSSSSYNEVQDIKFFNSFIYVLKNNRSNYIGSDILKYNTAGQLINSFNYNDSLFDLNVKGFSIASSGNLYIYGDRNNDIFVLKVKADSILGWVKYIDGGMNMTDKCNSASIDRNENIYLEGIGNWDISNNYSEMFTSKVDSNGSLQWLDLYHEPAWTWATGNAITLGNQNDFYIGGTAYIAGSGAVSILRKYTENDFTIIRENGINQIKVYPNPASDFINFYFPNNIEAANLTISDVAGRLIISEKIFGAQKSISVSILNNGIYFYAFKKDHQQSTGKIIIQK